jgi:ABC-type antimicrobial peptide transport system permease subunit
LISILILTVGIGSTVAVFSTIDALFLRPLPVLHPNELVEIVSIDKDGHKGGLFSTVLDGLAQDRAFQGVCGFGTSYLAVEIDGTLRTLGMAAFSGGCFKTLGLGVQLGRGLRPTDDHIGAEPVTVITDSLWHSQFGGRPDVLGRSIWIGTDTFRIVGVTAKPFMSLLLGFPEPVMIPLLQQQNLLPNGSKPTVYYVNLLARRAPGVSQAQALANIVAEKKWLLEQSIPHHLNALQREDYIARTLTLVPAQGGIDYFLRQRFGQPLFAIFGLCGAMLLMACVNLSSLLLARTLSRHREIAIRLALGAGPGHIAGIFVLENLLLVLAGAAIGIVAGFSIARVILAHGGQTFGNFDLHIGLDLRVVLFVFLVFLSVIGIFSAASLWQARRLGTALKRSGRA